MLRFLTVLFVLIPLCPGLSGASGEGAAGGAVLPERLFPELEEVLRRAAYRAPVMREEAWRKEEARAEAQVRSSGLYPSVSGNFRYVGRYEERSDFDGSRSDVYPQAGLTVRQPLYHWGSLRAEARVGRIREQVAANNRAEAFRLLALEVRSQYLNLAVRRAEIEVAERELALAENEWEAGAVLLEKGEITAEDLEDRRLARSEAQLHAERLYRELERTKDAFVRLVGDDSGAERTFPETIPAFAHGALAEGGPDRFGPGEGRPPHLENAAARVREAESLRETERSRLRPNLNLIAGVSQDQVAVFDRRDIDRTIFFAGLEVTWNIFDGFEARGRRAAANARKRLEERRRDRLEREWRVDVERLEDFLEFSARELELAEGRLELARADFERRRSEFEAGRGSDRDLARSRVARAKRELAVAEARADYLMQWAELLSESGKDPMMQYFRANVQERER